jgi:hypothetical protein
MVCGKGHGSRYLCYASLVGRRRGSLKSTPLCALHHDDKLACDGLQVDDESRSEGLNHGFPRAFIFGNRRLSVTMRYKFKSEVSTTEGLIDAIVCQPLSNCAWVNIFSRDRCPDFLDVGFGSVRWALYERGVWIRQPPAPYQGRTADEARLASTLAGHRSEPRIVYRGRSTYIYIYTQVWTPPSPGRASRLLKLRASPLGLDQIQILLYRERI